MFDLTDEDVELVLAALAPDPRPGWLGPKRWIGDGDDAVLRPYWQLVDEVPVVDSDLSVPQTWDAWQHAAEWTQGDVDESERYFRVHDAARTRKLLIAYRTVLADLSARFGAAQGHRGSAGVQVFFKQTGISLGMRPGQIARRVDAGLFLQDHLPLTWAAFRYGDATWVAVDLAARRAEGLEPGRFAAFDAAASVAVVSTPLASLKKKLRVIRERIQADTADQRAKATAERRTTTIEGGDDGEASWTLTGPAEIIHGIDRAVTKAAIGLHGAPGETRTMGQLRFDVAKDLLVEGIKVPARADDENLAAPGRKGIVPTVVVTVPVMTLLGHSKEPGRLEGYGPIAPDTARRIAATAPSFFRLLTHPITGVRLDLDRSVYSPPADLRRWVTLRDDTCRWPGCERPASHCDLDHATEWHDGGTTTATNLVSACRPDHNAKSTGLVTEQLNPDDSVDWHTPWNRVLTDPPPDPYDPAPDDCPF